MKEFAEFFGYWAIVMVAFLGIAWIVVVGTTVMDIYDQCQSTPIIETA